MFVVANLRNHVAVLEAVSQHNQTSGPRGPGVRASGPFPVCRQRCSSNLAADAKETTVNVKLAKTPASGVQLCTLHEFC